MDKSRKKEPIKYPNKLPKAENKVAIIKIFLNSFFETSKYGFLYREGGVSGELLKPNCQLRKKEKKQPAAGGKFLRNCSQNHSKPLYKQLISATYCTRKYEN